MKHRFATVARDPGELIRSLDRAIAGAPGPNAFMGVVDGDRGGADPGRIDSLVAVEDLPGLSRLWVRGARIPWEKTHDGAEAPPLTGLPVYPFARRLCRPDAGARSRPVASGLPGAPAPGKEGAPPPPRRPRTPADPGSAARTIRTVVDAMLNLGDDDELDESAKFSEMGFSSVTIVAFTRELNKAFGLTLRETIAFDHPTIREMAAHIASLLSENKDAEAPDAALDAILADFVRDDIDLEEALQLMES